MTSPRLLTGHPLSGGRPSVRGRDGVTAPLSSCVEHERGLVSHGRPNEALQQTRSAFASIGAALAAEHRCSTDQHRIARE
jgi:hypothetical protein